MSEVNGITSDAITSAIPTNPIIQLLEEALARARAGQITSLALIAINGQRAITPLVLGPQLCELQTGAQIVATMALNAMMSPQQQSRILRPGL